VLSWAETSAVDLLKTEQAVDRRKDRSAEIVDAFDDLQCHVSQSLACKGDVRI
jgi:hypothetical protein